MIAQRLSVAICLGLAMFGATASVQAQGRGRGMGSSLARLLTIEEVQKELKLDSAVLEKAKAYAETSQTKMREESQLIRDQGLSDADMRADLAALNDQMFAKDSEELAKIISADQMKRLKQLMLQQIGISAVSRKEVAEAIGIKEADRVALKKKVDDMNTANGEKMREMFSGGNVDRDAVQKIMAENRKQLDETVLESLDDAQEAKFKELVGAEFKFPEPQAGGGRRRDF